MSARSKARKRALDVLFEAELRGLPVLDLLAERITLGSPPVPAYAADLVRGVAVHTAQIDELISSHPEGYSGGSGSKFVLMKSATVNAPMTSWTRFRTNTASPGTFTIPALGTGVPVYYRIKSE